MDRRRFMQLSAASLGGAISSPLWALPDAPPDHLNARGLFVYVDPRIEPKSRSSLQLIRAAQSKSPLLAALTSGHDIKALDTSLVGAALASQLAYNHIILIGQADDPFIEQAWQMEAKISGDTIFAFGFGNLSGSLGYIESDRNPFLHAANVPKAPYECELITITGTDPAGISLAVDAFLTQGLVNGIVASRGAWKRGVETLLDRDPLPAGFTVPDVIPTKLGSLTRIAITQASEDEYRCVLADTGQEPASMWRAKYFSAGQWDGAGEISSFNNYVAGLHRRAYGNAGLLVTFTSEAVARASAPLMAKAAKLTLSNSTWRGRLGPYAWGLDWMGDSPQPGVLELTVVGPSVFMTSQIEAS